MMSEPSPMKWILGLLLIIIVGGAALFLTTRPEFDIERTEDREDLGPPPAAVPAGYEAMEREYLEGLKHDPENAAMRAALGDVYFESERFVQAIAEYEKVLQLDPSDVDTFNDLGLALHYTGRSEEAVSILKKGTGVNPSFQQIWLSLGFVLASSGRTEEAKASLKKTIDMNPETEVGREAVRILGRLP